MKPKLCIPDAVYRKVMYWIDKAPGEVSGLGMIEMTKEGAKVVDAILLPQKNSSTTTDIDPEGVHKALFTFREHPGKLAWWWHSHASMGVFWSGTDTATIKELGMAGWAFATVLNKKRESKSCFLMADGIKSPWGEQPLFYDDLEFSIAQEEGVQEAWSKEYEDNVKKYEAPARVWTYPEGGTGRVHHYGVNPTGRGLLTMTPTKNTAALTDYDVKEKPPEKRPENMTKRLYKRWKREWLANQDLRKPVLVVNKDDTDEYGFLASERAMLAQEGWDEHDIDYLFSKGFAPPEMVELAQIGVTPQEIEYTLMETDGSPYRVMEIARSFASTEHPAQDSDTPGLDYDPEETEYRRH